MALAATKMTEERLKWEKEEGIRNSHADTRRLEWEKEEGIRNSHADTRRLEWEKEEGIRNSQKTRVGERGGNKEFTC